MNTHNLWLSINDYLWQHLEGYLQLLWVPNHQGCFITFGVSFMAVMVLYHFNFSFESLAVKAVENHSLGEAILSPGGL